MIETLNKPIHLLCAYKGRSINVRSILSRVGLINLDYDGFLVPRYPKGLFTAVFNLEDRIIKISFKQYSLKAYFRLTLIPCTKEYSKHLPIGFFKDAIFGRVIHSKGAFSVLGRTHNHPNTNVFL